MGSKFQLVPLEEVVSIHDAKRKPITKSDRKSGPYPYYGASDIADYIDDYIFDGVYLLLSEDGDNLRTRNTPIAFIANGKFWVNNHAHVLQGEDELDTLFLCYALQYAEIDSYISGSTRPKITQSDLKKIPVYAPNIQIRRKIAKFIKSFDDKIILNRQINQTLEQMAQALFKSWFVDFDPVVDNALDAGFFEQNSDLPEALLRRAEQRKIVRQQPDFKPLPAETRQLFPAAFEACEEPSLGLGGWVPQGWEAKSIGNVSKFVKGKSYKSSELATSDTALVTLKSFQRGGGYRLDGLKPYIGSYKTEQVVSSGDLIISCTDVTQAADIIGKPAIVISDPSYKTLVISLDVSVVRPYKVTLKYYLYGLAKTLEFQSHTYAHSTGTTVLHLSKDAVPDFMFSSPSDEILELYHEMVSPFFDIIEKNNCSLRTLTTLRDTLLPKLISGELRLSDDGTLADGDTDC